MRNKHTGKATGGHARILPIHRMTARGITPRHRYSDDERAWVVAKIIERPELTNADVARLFAKSHECGIPPGTVRMWRLAMGAGA